MIFEILSHSRRFLDPTWPLMYQLRLAAGKLLAELQLAVSSSPGLYRGSVPLITGPSSGRSKKIFNLRNKYLIEKF